MMLGELFFDIEATKPPIITDAIIIMIPIISLEKRNIAIIPNKTPKIERAYPIVFIFILY